MENKLLAKKKNFGLYEASLATLLFIVFNVSFMFVYRHLPVSFRANKFVYYLVSFLIEFLFGVVAFVVAWSRNIDFFEASGIKKKFNFNIIFYGFLISVVSLIFFSDLTSIFLEFLGLCGYNSILSSFSINTFWEYLIYIVITCITPAVCEEILFRGAILSGLKNLGMKVCLVVSAIIFMLMHGNPEQTVHQFIIGLVVGYLFLKSGNIWLGVIVHFFNNFIAITQLYLLSNATTVTVAESVVVETAISPWVSLLINLVIALIFAYIGQQILKFLFKKILTEDEKLNNLNKETNAEIVVDGETLETVMTIDGTPANEEVQNHKNDFEKEQLKKTEWSLSVIVMFSLSAVYLVFEWVISLLTGFGLL